MQPTDKAMVTVELAMATLLVSLLAGLVCWFGLQLLTLDACQVAAHEIARQSARGDATGVRRASSAVPAGATVRVTDTGGATTVVVRFTPRLLGQSVTELEAKATVLDEARP